MASSFELRVGSRPERPVMYGWNTLDFQGESDHIETDKASLLTTRWIGRGRVTLTQRGHMGPVQAIAAGPSEAIIPRWWLVCGWGHD